jgi:hypothetical protein
MRSRRSQRELVTQRHRPPRGDRDDALRGELRSLSRVHPRSGYRKRMGGAS